MPVNDEIELDERVSVVVKFVRNGVRLCVPVRFKRPNGREITISEIGLHTPTRVGSKTLHIFDVTDGAADYRLEFDSERLVWRLTREADRWL